MKKLLAIAFLAASLAACDSKKDESTEGAAGSNAAGTATSMGSSSEAPVGTATATPAASAAAPSAAAGAEAKVKVMAGKAIEKAVEAGKVN